MFRSMTGKAYPATTVVTQWLVMIATTVNLVTEIIARSAAHTARCVIPHSALDVLMNVLVVMNRFARVVPLNVKSVKKYFAKTA